MNSKNYTYDFRNTAIEKQLDHILENAVIFDTETNGLASYNTNPKDNKEIVELALINPDGTTLYHSLFKPETPISATLAIVNNIDNEKLRDAPSWKDEWPKIRELMNGKNVVGFNNATFDNNALDETCRRYGIDFKNECHFNTIDVMPIFMKFTNLFPLTYTKSMMIKQEVARNICGLTNVQTHRADDDCRDLLELINEMKRRIIEKEPIKAEKFIEELPKKSMKRKYMTLLRNESRTQDMFRDLKNNVPIEKIIKEYSDLGSPINIEAKAVRLAKKGIINIDSQTYVDDETREKIYYHYKEHEDIGKAAIDLNVSTLQVRNVVDSLIKINNIKEKEEKSVKCEILENLTKPEIGILDEYAALNDRLAQVEESLENNIREIKNVFDRNVQMSDIVMADPYIKVEFKAGGKSTEKFDTSSFRNECPELYNEYIMKDRSGNPVMTSGSERISYKPNKEIITDIETLSMDSTTYTRDLMELLDQKKNLKKSIDKMKPYVKNILTDHQCNRIDTKYGKFTFSISNPNFKFDKDRFIREHPNIAAKYINVEVDDDKVSVRKAPKAFEKYESLNIWIRANTNDIRNDHEHDIDCII